MTGPSLERLAEEEFWDQVRMSDPDIPKPKKRPRLADTIAALLTPMTDAELEASRVPHPHVFQTGARGLFPEREVSVVAAPMRTGKTVVVAGTVTAAVIGHSLGRLHGPENRSAVIYSAEDDRKQYARMIAAQVSLLGPVQADMVKHRILVPDLDSEEMAPFRALITVADRRPIPTGTDTALIEAITPLMQSEAPPILLVFETASTLSQADEDNVAYSVLVACLKRVARALNVAVVLVHHTSQAANNNLPDLNISAMDIRGGTALVSNSRQNLMVVNLGSDDDPFPDGDARTVLRRMAAPHEDGRITALITLDSSKGMDPAPVFFRWVQTDYGPAAVEQEAPPTIAGKSWRKVREMMQAERGNQRTEAKANTQGANVTAVVTLVGKLQAQGKQPTARAVSTAAGKSPGWASPYLKTAAEDGLLVSTMESVPRTRGEQLVYRPVDSSEVAA